MGWALGRLGLGVGTWNLLSTGERRCERTASLSWSENEAVLGANEQLAQWELSQSPPISLPCPLDSHPQQPLSRAQAHCVRPPFVPTPGLPCFVPSGPLRQPLVHTQSPHQAHSACSSPIPLGSAPACMLMDANRQACPRLGAPGVVGVVLATAGPSSHSAFSPQGLVAHSAQSQGGGGAAGKPAGASGR